MRGRGDKLMTDSRRLKNRQLIIRCTPDVGFRLKLGRVTLIPSTVKQSGKVEIRGLGAFGKYVLCSPGQLGRIQVELKESGRGEAPEGRLKGEGYFFVSPVVPNSC